MVEEKTRKELLEEPDPFMVFIGQALAFVKKYQQQIVMAVMAVFILVVAVSGMLYFKSETENRAATMLSKATEKYNAVVRKNANIVNPKEAPGTQYDEAINAFKEIIDKYGSTGAGKAALLNYADLSYLKKDYDEAIKTYEKALNIFGNKVEFKNLILNGLAYSYEAKNDNDNAVKYYNMIASGDSPLLKDQALFNLGRIYESQGKPDKEAEEFKRLISEFPDSMFAKLAKEKIAG